MDELQIGDKLYLSSKKAAAITGYAKDYIGQLCREGRVEARLVGRNWYVLDSAIREHRFGAEGLEPGAAAPEAAPEPAEEPAAVREAEEPAPETPRYAPEPAVYVPELTKPIVEPEEAITSMQDAWKEWHASKEPVRAEGFPEEEAAEPEVRYEESVPEPEEEEEVALRRLPDEPEEEEEQPVVLHHARLEELEELMAEESSPVVDLSRHEEPVLRIPVGKSGGGMLAVRALLIGIAFISVVIALMGTGIADDVLHSNLRSGIVTQITDFLSGEISVERETK